MSLLSDSTIRELCVAGQYKPYRAILREVRSQHPLEFDPRMSVTEQAVAEQRYARALYAGQADRPMIYPFEPHLVREIERTADQKVKVPSYGTTSYGYDVSLSPDGFKLFTNVNAVEIDPLNFDTECLVDASLRVDPTSGLRYFLLPPHSYGLGVTREHFMMPRDVLAVCLGKSTYARAGVLINTTPIEPGFEGTVVLEISNLTGLPARVYVDGGIAQFLFFRGDRPCETSYGDRGGKYQHQSGVTLPIG
jgi:dCTP deaminase